LLQRDISWLISNWIEYGQKQELEVQKGWRHFVGGIK